MMSIGQITQLPEDAWTSIVPNPPSLEDERTSTARRRNTQSHYSCECPESASAISCGAGPEPDETSPNAWILGREETDKLFAALVKARSPRRSQDFSLLVSCAKAREILDVALKQYERYGYEGRLSLAADLLSEMGDDGWAALNEFCDKGQSECAYFVDAIAAFRSVRRAQRVAVLRRLASSPDPEVRAGVLNSQRYRPDCFDPSILDELRIRGDDEERGEVDQLADSCPHFAPVA
jgi:hypothetical protein